jgi:hypothetical protein
MLLSGLKNLTLSLILFALNLSLVYAEDFGIALPDQLKDDSAIQKSFEVDKGKDDVNFVMGDRHDDLKLDEDDSQDEPLFAVPGKTKEPDLELSEKEKILSTGNEVPYTYEDSQELISFKNERIHEQIYNKAESSFSMSYIMDSYDISDNRGVFKESFIDAPGAQRGGSILLNFDEYFRRGTLNTFMGLGFGLGYSLGQGIFSSSSSEQSNAEFKLYSIPVDFRLGFDLVTGKLFRLSVAGGPSVMGLLQSRSDLEREDGDKYRRQISYGYFGNAKLQISLSALSSSRAFNMLSISDVTNMFFNLEARFQSYENFQDQLSITGASFGAGFTFEYF